MRTLVTRFWQSLLRDLGPESTDGHLARLSIEDCFDLEALDLALADPA